MNHYYDAHLSYLEDLCKLAKQYGVTLIELHQDGKPKRIEFALTPQFFEAGAPPKTDEEKTEPGGYETALERMARGGKKDAPKT